MEDYNEYIDCLILQYSKGAISPKGLEELLFWIEKDIENKKYFKEQIAILRNIQAPLVHFNAKKGLLEFQKSMMKAPRYFLSIRMTAIAASILFIVIIGKVITNRLIDGRTETIEYVAQKNNLTKILDDNTKITLSKSSILLKPKQFTSKSRKVELLGKAFFEVAKDKNSPFIINCKNINITVLGTSFEVEMDTLKDCVKVTVSDGIVSVSSKKSDFQKNVSGGIQVTVSQNGVLLDESKIKNENYLFWKTGILVYDNTPMAKIAEELMEIYGKKIVFEDEDLRNERVTTKINNKPFDEVKILLEVILNSKIDEKGDTLTFRKNY